MRRELLALALLAACARAPGVPEAHENDPQRLHALLINGGGKREINYRSHLGHLRELLALLQTRGVPVGNVHVLTGDGEDPAPDLAVRAPEGDARLWLLPKGPVHEAFGPVMEYVSTTLPGYRLRPARRAVLEAWFDEEGRRLGAGDTLLLYVTDHGQKGPKPGEENTITLWGESLTVNALRGLLGRLSPSVRVVMLMSQCFSGAFADAIYPTPGATRPAPNRCGYFSTTSDRLAFGCYPEGRGTEGVGHSDQLFEALDRVGTLSEAHRRVLVTDRTPDVPLATSTTYLVDLFLQRGMKRGAESTQYVDRLLSEAWKDSGAWEPDLRLLDQIGAAFGLYSPRTVRDALGVYEALLELQQPVEKYQERWEQGLEAARITHWSAFLEAHPEWKARLPSTAREAPRTEAERAPARRALLDALEAFTKKHPTRYERMKSLRARADQARETAYRLESRLAATLRMMLILDSIAGRVMFAKDGTPAERADYAALQACEALPLGGAPLARSAAELEPPPPFPSLDDDRRRVQSLAPGWLGIQYQPLPPSELAKRRLETGAVVIQNVLAGTPAAKAGLEVGDVLLGHGDGDFHEPHEVLQWTLSQEVGKPVSLRLLRGTRAMKVGFVPEAVPLKLPPLPGPPAVGEVAPPLRVEPYRNAVLPETGPRLLFFWATWCTPCKRSVPELLALAAARNLPVIAITDEEPEVLDRFFATRKEPFPTLVATDRLRLAFRAYGVSGTPTYVLIDGKGKIAHYRKGYGAEGLRIPELNEGSVGSR